MILVTIPKTTKEKTIFLEMEVINELNGCGLHKVGKQPKQLHKTIEFVYNGEVRFKADIIEYTNESFICTTTHKEWDKSWYIKFNDLKEIPLEDRTKQKGFQGFRYIGSDYCG